VISRVVTGSREKILTFPAADFSPGGKGNPNETKWANEFPVEL
jgi:hypothetical protein